MLIKFFRDDSKKSQDLKKSLIKITKKNPVTVVSYHKDENPLQPWKDYNIDLNNLPVLIFIDKEKNTFKELKGSLTEEEVLNTINNEVI